MCSLGCRSATVAQLLRRAVRQSDGRADRLTRAGRERGERRTSKDPKHAQSEEVRPSRQAGRQAVSRRRRRRGNRLRNSFPRYNNHNSHKRARARTHKHTYTHTQTRAHSKIEAQPQLKSFYCPQHKRAQRASTQRERQRQRQRESNETHSYSHSHTHAQRIRKQKPAAAAGASEKGAFNLVRARGKVRISLAHSTAAQLGPSL